MILGGSSTQQSTILPHVVPTDAIGGHRRTVGHVLRRRRCDLVLAANFVASSIATSGYTSTNPFPVAAYDEALVYLVGSSLTGTAAGVQWQVQMLDKGENVYLTLPGGGPWTVTAQTGTVGLDIRALSNFGDWLRIGLTCSAPWTGGNVAVWFKGKQ